MLDRQRVCLYSAFMVNKIDPIPAGELAILRTLWQRGVATIRELMEAVYAEVANRRRSKSIEQHLGR